jgi:CRP/FNR family transcriptional regulator, polysaccharide utilization system transcription regulator
MLRKNRQSICGFLPIAVCAGLDNFTAENRPVMYRAETEKTDILDLRLSFMLNKEDAEMDLFFASCNKSKTKEYQTGKVLYTESSEPSGVYILKQGKVKLIQKNKEGDEKVLGNVSSGCYLGLCSLIRNKKNTSTAIAIDDCLVDFIPRQEFFKLLAQYPSISHKILVGLCKLLDTTEDEIAAFDVKGIRKRLAEVLEVLFKNEKTDGEKNTIKISVKNLAGLAKTTEDIVKEYLDEFKEKKIITIKGTEIKLIDSSALGNI